MNDLLILFERDGAIVTLTLNRPDKRNALNLALWGELAAHLDTIEEASDAIAVVVLRAKGAVFCAGNDLKERVQRRRPEDRDDRRRAHGQRMPRQIERSYPFIGG